MVKLCIVILLACDKGHYGKNCSLVCNANCQHTDELCTCKAGWMGIGCKTGGFFYISKIIHKKHKQPIILVKTITLAAYYIRERNFNQWCMK